MNSDTRSELLVKYGFIKKDRTEQYFFNKETKEYEPLSGDKPDKNDADEEAAEIVVGDYQKTGYPTPLRRSLLMWEVPDLSLEEPYFWVLDQFRDHFPITDKVEDSFAAAENSAFFGVTQQRLGAQQDKVSQFLATMGKMVKELFQMVRELRIIEERLTYYDEAEKQLGKEINQRSKSAEITLKGLFVDLVQGGGKSAASVYGMARELEFITLPDLFFDAPPFKDEKELDNHIKLLGANFNQNVLRVLIRHLRQFMEWKKSTHHEHKNRQRFMLKYLQQHYDIIQMYLNWVKPYLRHVSRLTMKEKSLEAADIVSSFETTMLDVEYIARKKKGEANGCVLVTFNYRTRAELKVQQEGYQRGPVHIGRVEMTFRAYAWSDEQVENYKKMKEKESLELLGDISASIKEAMDSLGKELERYLKEAKGEKTEKEKEESRRPLAQRTFLEKFFGDFYTPKGKGKPKFSSKELRTKRAELDAGLNELGNLATFHCFNVFHLFKKAHGMIAW